MNRSRSPSRTSPGLVGGHARPQILDQLIGLQDVGPDLVAPADVGLGGIGLVGHGLALLQLGLVQPCFQLLHRLRAVLVLRAVVLEETTIPVGTCVILTALSVVLTCCPPAPEAR